MLTIFGVALLVLAVAVIVLFAMFGELATRVPAAGQTARDPAVRPLQEARLGTSLDRWPAGLAPPDGQWDRVLLVLSPTCATCADIALQLTEQPGHTDWTELGVVVSAMNKRAGDDFVARHGLTAFPCHVDAGGEWISEQFGVRLSPSALVFRDGQLSSAHMFYDVAALRAKVRQESADTSMQKEHT